MWKFSPTSEKYDVWRERVREREREKSLPPEEKIFKLKIKPLSNKRLIKFFLVTAFFEVCDDSEPLQ